MPVLKVRTKKVTMGGAEYIVAPLSVGQFREISAAFADLKAKADSAPSTSNESSILVKGPTVEGPTVEEYQAVNAAVVAYGINNAIPLGPDRQTVSGEEVIASIDADLLNFLFNEIINFNGLKIQSPSGESQAASTSQPSDAALPPVQAGPLTPLTT